MLVGITVPQFRGDADGAVAVARAAEAEGLDGAFVFDHLWPLRQPTRPALYSHVLLGALAAETGRVVLGPLVARVGLLPDAVLVDTLLTLRAMLGARLLVTLGTGDGANRDENLAYGIGFPPAARRLAMLVACCQDLRAEGVETWVGGRSTAIRSVATQADGWNTWGTDAATFAAEAEGFRRALAALEAPGSGPRPAVSWGGQVLIGRDQAEAADKVARHGSRPGLVHGTVETLAAHLRALARAGAAWAVCAPLDVGSDPRVPGYVAEAATAVR